MEYYVYTYFLDDGTAYYVGKGNRARVFMRHNVPVPEQHLIQYFLFETEVEAWDTEIQLISLYGRQQDGGTLMNLSTGGQWGCSGVIHSAVRRQQQSDSAKQWIAAKGHPQKGRVGCNSHSSLTYVVTTPSGNCIKVKGLRQYCIENNLEPTCMYAVAKGKRNHHKGYTVKRAD